MLVGRYCVVVEMRRRNNEVLGRRRHYAEQIAQNQYACVCQLLQPVGIREAVRKS